MRRSALWPTLIATGTLLVLALFLITIQRNVAEMRTLRDGSTAVAHTLEVQRTLGAVLATEADADAALRAYLLTGLPDFLEQVRDAERTTRDQVETLASLTTDNPLQQARVATLRGLAAGRDSGAQRLLDLHHVSGPTVAMAAVRASEASVAGDRIRAIVREMEDDEAHLLDSRRAAAESAYGRAIRGRVGSGLVSAILLISIVATAGLHARSKARREQALVASERRAVAAVTREHQARAEAERLNREKDQFLAVLSHELRTPLNAVLGWTQILQVYAADDPTTTRALNSIRRNADAQHRLVEDLLDVSRIVSGKLPFECQPFDPGQAVRAAVESIRPSADGKQIAITVSLEPTPSLEGDAGRLQQLVGNLLSNAVKFTDSGGRITVTLRHDGAHVELEVSDTGAGIPLDLQPHIFERFRQGDGSTTRAHGGLGLGLAIARHIAEAHGGTIAVASIGAGHGSTFRVRLPYR